MGDICQKINSQKNGFRRASFLQGRTPRKETKSREGCEADRRFGSPLVGSTAHEHKTLVAKLVGKSEGCNVTDSNHNIPYCEEVHIPH